MIVYETEKCKRRSFDMIPIDQTTAIIITCAVGTLFGITTLPIGFMMFMKELNKELIKEVRNGN